jgi:hypothetical protein
VLFDDANMMLTITENIYVKSITPLKKLLFVAKYPTGKKIDWPSIASTISSDEDIKKMNQIIKIDEQIMDEINNNKPLKYEDIINVPNTEKKKIFFISWMHSIYLRVIQLFSLKAQLE